MKKNATWIIWILSFFFCSCSFKPGSDLKINTYQTIYKASSDSLKRGLIINPGDSFQLQVDFKKYDFPVKRKVRITGGGVFPAPYQKRDEENFRNFLYVVNDCLDSTDTYKQKFSLCFKGNNEGFDRNAYFRLSENEFIKSEEAQVSFAAKASGLTYSENGGLSLEVRFYFKKPGIHPDDIFDNPGLIRTIPVTAGTYGWKLVTEKIMVPANTACILFRIGGKNFNGICRFEAPQFIHGETVAPVAPFARYNATGSNWIGENLSTKEWPHFEISLDNKEFFSGEVFDRGSQIADFEIELPPYEKGNHSLKIKLLKKFPTSFPFQLLDIGLTECGGQDFEVAHVPEFVFAKKEFAILIEINKPGMDVRFGAKGPVHPIQGKISFDQPGLYAVRYIADSISLNAAVLVSAQSRTAKIPIRQVLQKTDDSIFIGCTDDVYINRNKSDFSEYLEWYCREGIGNAIGFRPSYQWSGTRNADIGFYKWAASLLSQLNMPYALMLEGRSIPEKDVNPADEIISSPVYLGRQAHENDGAFYYWGQYQKFIRLHSDLYANLRPQGGIFPKTRVKRNEKGTFIYFDPYASKDMKEAADRFVENLKTTKGESSRHTGPSTLFRYFLQAGYSWIGAEQMYGAEDVTMSSLRGACKAYGKKNYGTHLATQWSSGPYDAPEHATRLFQSLAVSYMHGANHINTEDGLWNTEDNHNRYTHEGKEHIQQQKKLFDFIQTHQRRGSFVAPIAIVQGRNDAWKCFGKYGTAWSLEGDEWAYGPAENSMELLHVFYPNSNMDAIYKFPCPKEKQGWYTGMPYGPVDLLPIEAPEDVINTYKALVFLSWNTFAEEDFAKLLSFVSNGGTLLLAKPHMNTELHHGAPAKLPESRILEDLLGKDFSAAKGIVRRRVGNGRVIYFASDVYPSDSTIRKEYEKELTAIAEAIVAAERKKGWIKGTEVVEFTAYDWPDNQHRTLYLLNTDWWSTDSVHSGKLLLGEKEFNIITRRGCIETITLYKNMAVMPASMQTDIIGMKISGNKLLITIQTTGPDVLTVYNLNGNIKERIINGAGLQEVAIEMYD